MNKLAVVALEIFGGLGAETDAHRQRVFDREGKGFFYRSDHFEFAKEGVPALYVDAGTRFIGKADDYGQQKRDQYTTNDYHQVTDEVKSDWDLEGAVQDAHILFRVGYRVATMDVWPEWKPGTEFKATRDAMLGK